MFMMWQNTTPIYELPFQEQIATLISFFIIIFGMISFYLFYHFKEKGKTIYKNISLVCIITSIIAYLVFFLFTCYETGKNIEKDNAEADTVIIQENTTENQ